MHRVVRLLFLFAWVALLPLTAYAQAARAQAYTPPRTPEGQPNLQGVWRVWNLAKYDIEPHVASPEVPAGMGVIVDPPDGMIPYKPWARAHKNENFAKSRISYPYDPIKSADPLGKCYIPGVPRATYLGWPFQIFQSREMVLFLFEWNHHRRFIPLTNRPRLKAPEYFGGISRGRFEGNTLVVDVTNLSDYTWLDMAGNFHSNTAHVIERYTPTGPDTLDYEVTIEDPRVYTRPWKMRMPIQRQNDPLLEYECIDLLEEAGRPPIWERDWDKELPVPKE